MGNNLKNELAVGKSEIGAGVERPRSYTNILPYVLVFPAVMVILLLYLYPFLASFWKSFISKEGVLGLANYEKTLRLYRYDILFTMGVTILSTLIATILSILLAVYLRLTKGWIANIVGILYRLPIFLPFVVIAQMMRSFLAPHGTFNLFLAKFGIIDIENPLQMFNWIGLTFGFVWKEAPFMVLIILGGFQMTNDSYIEAAKSVGAKLPQIITKVLIPMNKTTILIAVTLVFCSLVGCFSFPYMLIGGKSPVTITVDIAHRVNYFGDYGVANALGVFSYIMVSILALYYVRSMMRKGLYD
ncbi:sugar ABC transporter permease [bacterium]|nr:sugar ABC transporter permease [bacterium]MBU1428457.1 sugar ABC transporter permease [bacterium]MBU4563081.1 sugar ABC transporter permease [bacterium]